MAKQKFKIGDTIWAIWPDQRRPKYMVYLPGIITGINTIMTDPEGEFIEIDELEDYIGDIKIFTTYFINYTNSTQQIHGSEEALLKSEVYKKINSIEGMKIRRLDWQDI